MAGTLTQLRVVSDPTGLMVVRQWPGFVNNVVLGVATNETQTPPNGASMVIITPTTDVWINKNAVATVPAADVTDGGGQILCPAGIPTGIGLAGITTFGLISAAAGIVCEEYSS